MRRLLDWLRWTRTGDRELAEEIRTHVQIETERLIGEDGLSRIEAESAAWRRFGNVLHATEDSRAVWGFGPLDSWVQDVRFGLRLLARYPVFTVVTVASLALGIGASIGGFGLLDAVLLRPLPVADPQQLVLLRWVSPQHKDPPAQSIHGWLDLDDGGGQQTSTSFSYVAYAHLRRGQTSFSDLIAFAEIPQLLVRQGSQSDISSGQYVSGNYFRGLGVPSMVGRPLGPADDRPDAEPAAMISYEGWQRRFGGSPSAIGTHLVLNRAAVVIVGVTPRGFQGCLQVGMRPEFTLPMSLQPVVTPGDGRGLDDAGYWWVQVMGRLRPGTPHDRAVGELAALFDRHVASLPAPPGAEVGIPKLRAMPGGQGLLDQRRELASPLAFIAVLVALVLLLSAANVSGLLLARGTARAREMGIRLAIGAGRARLVRQMLTESVMLSLLGGSAGLVLAAWFVPLLVSAAQPQASTVVVVPFQLDARLVLFAVAISVLVGIILGVVTIAAGRFDVSLAVRERSTTVGAGRPRLRLGKALVAAQIALSLLFVVLAGLFVETLRNLQHVDTGINPDNVLSFRIEPGLQGYDADRRLDLLQTIGERIQTIPGVRSGGFSRNALFTGSSAIATVMLPGGAKPAVATGPSIAGTPIAWVHAIGGRFLETLGVPLVSGRRFDDRDASHAPRVALVNRAFARHFFGKEEVVGRIISNSKDGPPLEIVGLVGDARYTDLRQEPPPTIYVPFTQRLGMFQSATFYLRTRREPGTVVADVRRLLRTLDAGLPVLDVKTLVEQIDQATERERRVAGTATFFGGLTVLLAGIGLYGVMAYAVSRRTGELGVRLALGASPRQLVIGVLGESGVVVTLGVVIGLAATVAGGRFVRSQLFGIQPTDTMTLLAAALVVALVSLAASYIPARRASRVDPLTALRNE